MFNPEGLVAVLPACCQAGIIFLMLRCKSGKARKTTDSGTISLSVIIPFRNEEENLPALLQSLKAALPAPFPVEIIGVDDFSDDASAEVFLRQAQGIPHRLIKNRLQTSSPKRDAQSLGISAAQGNWILLLDADTQIPEDYFAGLAKAIQENQQASLMLGPVVYDGNTKDFWSGWQQEENLRLQSLTHYSALCGRPLMANGAHMLFKKSRFESIEGFHRAPGTAGGDDMFLLLQWKKHFPDEVAPLPLCKNLLVSTRGEKDLEGMMRQRLRWARKTRILRDKHISVWSAWQTLVYITFFVGVLWPAYWLAGNLIWFAAEYALSRRLRKVSGHRRPVFKALGYHFVFPFVYTGIMISVWLPVPVKWKRRTFKW